MKSNHCHVATPLKRVLTVAGAAVMLSVSSVALAQAAGGSGSRNDSAKDEAAKASATTTAVGHEISSG